MKSVSLFENHRKLTKWLILSPNLDTNYSRFSAIALFSCVFDSSAWKYDWCGNNWSAQCDNYDSDKYLCCWYFRSEYWTELNRNRWNWKAHTTFVSNKYFNNLHFQCSFQNLKETYCRIKEEWPSKKPKPDLIVIKKKKLIPKHTSNSFSTDKIHFPHPNIGTNNDESKESKNFLPSPELSEDSSHASVTHDTYPVSTKATYFSAGRNENELVWFWNN